MEDIINKVNKNTKLGNAFSLQMLDSFNNLALHELSLEQFEDIKHDLYSCVGHEDTAKVLGVKFNRESISLSKGDTLVVAQLVGGRLPEGSTTLPESFSFKYILVEVI